MFKMCSLGMLNCLTKYVRSIMICLLANVLYAITTTAALWDFSRKFLGLNRELLRRTSNYHWTEHQLSHVLPCEPRAAHTRAAHVDPLPPDSTPSPYFNIHEILAYETMWCYIVDQPRGFGLTFIWRFQLTSAVQCAKPGEQYGRVTLA